MADAEYFTDGLWHQIIIDIVPTKTTTNKIGQINVTVDGRPDVSNRQLTFKTTSKYLIGG